MGAIGVVEASTVCGPCRIGSNDLVRPTRDVDPDSSGLCTTSRDWKSASRELEGISRDLDAVSRDLDAVSRRLGAGSNVRGAGSCELGPAGCSVGALCFAGVAVAGLQFPEKVASSAGGGRGRVSALGGWRARSCGTGAGGRSVGGDGDDEPEPAWGTCSDGEASQEASEETADRLRWIRAESALTSGWLFTAGETGAVSHNDGIGRDIEFQAHCNVLVSYVK